MSKAKGNQQAARLADMSLAPEQRGRPERSTPRQRRRVPAQLDHAQSPQSKRWAKQGERVMERSRGTARDGDGAALRDLAADLRGIEDDA